MTDAGHENAGYKNAGHENAAWRAQLTLDQILDELQTRMTQARGARERINSLLVAVLSVGRELELEQALQRILESAAELVDARYGALAVLGEGGTVADFLTTGLTEDQIRAIGAYPSGRGVLGELITHPAPLRLDDIATHPTSVGFPAGHPPMRTFIGTPIRVRGEVFGNLYLTDKCGAATFTQDDEAVLSTLAVAAGVAIDNARLYRGARQRERWLAANTEIVGHLLAGGDRAQVLDLLMQRARDITGAALAVIALPDRATDHLEVEFAAGAEADMHRGLLLPPGASFCGAAYRERRPVTSADIARDPRAADGPPRWHGLGPAVAVAIGVGDDGDDDEDDEDDEVRGVLMLARAVNQPQFTGEDCALLQSFAAQAAVALELADRRRDAGRLTLLAERDRIARDLHDLAIQRLFATGMTLQSAERFIEHESAGERVHRAVTDLDDTVKIIRSAIFGLRAHTAQPGGPGLRARTVEAVEQAVPALGFTPSLRMEGLLDTDVPPQLAADTVAALCEALGNIARHAGATSVDILLQAGAELLLTVTDNGRGITPGTGPGGLRNLTDRAAHHGGTLSLTDAPAGGTRFTWRAPLPHAEAG